MERQDDFLRRGKVMRLATVDGNGMPHVVPVWYMYRDSRIYVGTNTRTIKAKNVLQTGRVAFCVDEGVHSPLYGVMARGRADLVTAGARVRSLAGDILLRYFDSLDSPSARTLLDDTDCVIVITPGRLTHWS